MTYTTISESLSSQDDRIDRLDSAVRRLEEALRPVLNPDLSTSAPNQDDCDVPLMASTVIHLNGNNDRISSLYIKLFNLADQSTVIHLNGNNDRISSLYIKLFNLADRLALEPPSTEAAIARPDESDFR